VRQDFFGQLLQILVIDVPAAPQIGINTEEKIILAAIRPVKVMERTSNGIVFYKDYGPVEVVDLNVIQCVVGRIWDREKWAIVDRKGALAQAVFTDD
jgi:hypothetical protein